MITFILGAALLGLFLATVVVVFGACLKVYDWVISHVSGKFKAIKVLIKNKWGEVSSGTLVQTGTNIKLYTDPEHKKVSDGELDPDLKKAFETTKEMDNGDKMVEFKPDKDAEREIRRRCC